MVPADLRRGVETDAGLPCDRLPLPLQKRFLALACATKTLMYGLATGAWQKPVCASSTRRSTFPPTSRNANRSCLATPSSFYYKYGEPEKDFGQRTALVGPFNAIFGSAETMDEQRRSRE